MASVAIRKRLWRLQWDFSGSAHPEQYGPRSARTRAGRARAPAFSVHVTPTAHVCAPGVITGISQVAWMIPTGFLWNSQRVKGGERRLLLATGVSPARFVR